MRDMTEHVSWKTTAADSWKTTLATGPINAGIAERSRLRLQGHLQKPRQVAGARLAATLRAHSEGWGGTSRGASEHRH